MQVAREFLCLRSMLKNLSIFFLASRVVLVLMLLNEKNVNILSKLIEESQNNKGNAMYLNGIETSATS